MLIYTIGAITYHYQNGEPNKAIEWRADLDSFAKIYNVLVFDPTRTYTKDYVPIENDHFCVMQNDYYLKQTDIAVVNLDALEHSPGSVYELVMCKVLGIPTIAFGDSKWRENPHIESCIDSHVESLDDVKDFLYDMFLVHDI